MKTRLLRMAVAVTGLGLIGAGCWLVAPPLAFIVVGALVWVDLSIGSLRIPRSAPGAVGC